jgi:hypothetical protein
MSGCTLNVNNGLYAIFFLFCIFSFILPATAITLSPGDTRSSTPTIANGDPVIVNGIATGHPQNGLQVWLVGTNYVKIDSVSVNADNSYSYELKPADTQSLAQGQYMVIIQHPMMNGEFDITYNPATGQVINRQLGAGTGIFQLTGPGSLQTPSGGLALMQAISSQNIDDTFTTVSFLVSPPNAFIDPPGDHVVGDRFTVGGSTNLAVGDNLMVEITSSSFRPTQKGGASEFSGVSGMVQVVPGTNGYNRWSFDVDTAAFRPDEYILQVSGITVDVTGSTTFNLVEKIPTTPAAAITTVTVTTTPATVPASPVPTPSGPAQPVPTKAPVSLPGIISILVVVVIARATRKR